MSRLGQEYERRQLQIYGTDLTCEVELYYILVVGKMAFTPLF